MIIIAGTVDVDPEQRAAALDAGRPHVDGALTQKGCVAYSWSSDPHIPRRIHVERWDSEQDLAAHLAGSHYLAMRDTIGGHGMVASDVAKFRIDLMEPVYDPQGRPRADFFTEKT